MNEILNGITHFFHLFDNFFHLCFLVSIALLIVGTGWTYIRVLRPLHQLAAQARLYKDGYFFTFDLPISGIKEVDQLRQSLHGMMQQIKEAQAREIAYRNALTDSQENERMRIAHDLHDDAIQSLVVTTHSVDRAAQAVTLAPSCVLDHLKTARTQLVETIDSLRGIIANLRPTILDELGLVTAVEMLCEGHHALGFSVQGEVYEIDHAQELAIFRIAQEAIRNAERHAHADSISARLCYATSGVRLEVIDDGIGFKLPPQLQEFAAKGHYGLLGIRERVLHVGGQLELVSEAYAGTRIAVTFPSPNSMTQRHAAAAFAG